MKLLDVDASDKRIVGLYGMGGIGKTTIAKFIYNKLFHEFQACSFLADVKELSHTQGLVCLQKQLIYDISKQSNTDFSRIDDGIKLIRERFRDKKVIIVLDDVRDKKEVDALIGGIEWFGGIECFGAGSRVIITTRDKEVVNIPMGKSYEVKELDDGKSLKLFCRHAFKRGRPLSKSKVELASKIVATTGGLPLALEVIGSLLYKKNLEVWRGTFEQMKVSPHDKIQTTLMISYRDLNERQRELFLDIACLFIGYYKQSVFPMWNACQLIPESNFSALVNKCLVRIDCYDRICMHDQLRDFGRDLVRNENITQPGNWSRVWDMKDVLAILRGYKDTCKTEAITYDIKNFSTKLVLTNEEFANKSSLRYLRVRGADFDGNFNRLFPKLIWLSLENSHFHYTLTNFCPEKLVILDIWHCDITENWNGWKILEMAVNLKILVINYCKNMRKSPKFTKDNALEKLSLYGCGNMVEIDASIKSLEHLIFLGLSGCRSLKQFPEELLSLKKLKALYINGSVINFLPNSVDKMSALESILIIKPHWSQRKLPKFSIRNLSSLRKLPKSIGELQKLRELQICECPLEKLPSSVTSLKSLAVLQVIDTKIRNLPNSIGNLKNLKELNISCNYYLQGLPNSVWNLKKLETLDASRCKAMEVSIPDDIGNLINLRIMNLEGTKIQSMSTSICSLSSIQELDLRAAFFLKSLPDLPTNVQILKISCVAGISSVLNKLRNLKTLDYHRYFFNERDVLITVPLKSPKAENLPPLSSNLKSLSVKHCESLESLGDLSNLTNLSRLEVNRCPRIMEICGLNKLVSLTYLNLSGCSGLVTLDGLEHLALLRELLINECRSIEELPDLSHLKYLRKICNCNCKNFKIQKPEGCLVIPVSLFQDFPEWQ